MILFTGNRYHNACYYQYTAKVGGPVNGTLPAGIVLHSVTVNQFFTVVVGQSGPYDDDDSNQYQDNAGIFFHKPIKVKLIPNLADKCLQVIVFEQLS